MENSLKKYIHKLRLYGGFVNKMILISAAHGIVEYYNRSLLKKYSGCLELSHAWAKSFISRLGLVKRKGMKAAQKLPDDSPTIKLLFGEKINGTIHKPLIS